MLDAAASLASRSWHVLVGGEVGSQPDLRLREDARYTHKRSRTAFLKLAERCCDFEAPSQYSGLLRDSSQLMSIPLDGYRTFIDDFVERIGEMPELMR
jgi:hypothetical protein